MANVLIVPTLLAHPHHLLEPVPRLAVEAKEPLDPGVSPASVEAVDFRYAEMVHLGLTHGYFACELSSQKLLDTTVGG